MVTSTEFINAAETGDIDIIRTALGDSEFDPCITDDDGDNALMCATSEGHTEVVRELLRDGRIDINARRMNGATAVFCAAIHDNTQILRALLEDDRVDPNITADDGEDLQGLTALHIAAEQNNAQIVKALLEDGRIDPNFTDSQGDTALIWACFKGNIEVVKVLLEDERVDLNIRGEEGVTALTQAAELGEVEIVTALLKDSRIDSNIVGKEGRTALVWASRCGQPGVIRVLLEDNLRALREFRISRADSRDFIDGYRYILTTKGENYHELLKESFWPMIFLGAVYRQTDSVRLMLSCSKVVADEIGDNAFIWAAKKGSCELIRVLLKDGRVNPNAIDRSGHTALMYAARFGYCRGNKDTVLTLLRDRRVNQLTTEDLSKLSQCHIKFYENTSRERSKRLFKGFLKTGILLNKMRLEAAENLYAPDGAGFFPAYKSFNSLRGGEFEPTGLRPLFDEIHNTSEAEGASLGQAAEESQGEVQSGEQTYDLEQDKMESRGPSC